MKLVQIAKEIPKSQEDWINWHNTHETIMASAAEFYQAAKEQGLSVEDTETSTRIYWKGDQKEIGEVVHNFGSTSSSTITSQVIVPFFSCNYVKFPKESKLEKVLETKEGLDFLQTLFNTQDKPEDLIQTLKVLGYKPRKSHEHFTDEIFVATPPKELRKEHAKVTLITTNSGLHIKCYLQTFGRSNSYKVEGN